MGGYEGEDWGLFLVRFLSPIWFRGRVGSGVGCSEREREKRGRENVRGKKGKEDGLRFILSPQPGFQCPAAGAINSISTLLSRPLN
jgi:hypothetical protein